MKLSPRRAHVALVALALAFTTGASLKDAVAAPPRNARPIVDNAVMRATRTGIFGVHTLHPKKDSVPVVIELAARATDADVAKLEALGAKVSRSEGQVVMYDRFVPAHVDGASVTKIGALANVVHVSMEAAHRSLPLDQSAKLIGLEEARGSQQTMDDLIGDGITIGDVDSLVDVFHPTMFRGDGGYFAWIDVDGDGVFTPGTDAIDFDSDGKAGAGETAVPIIAQTVDYGTPIAGARKNTWNPGTDWVYLDTNGNKSRDYGKAGGFDDTAPAFGEPLFVPDDLDRSGAIEVGEKFVLLKTSKLRKARVNVTFEKTAVNHTYVRGTDMATMPTDLTNDALYGFPDAFHASGVLTIAAGDVPLTGRKWVGMAPGVDIVETFDVDDSGSQLPTTGATWAIQQKPDVMLYELALWTGVPLDGSDALSAIIDTSNQTDNVTHTCPTGDQGSARKHARSAIAAGATVMMPFDLPAMDKEGDGPLTYVEMTAHVRTTDIASASLIQPDGTAIPIINNTQGPMVGGAMYYATVDTTSRGTFMYDVILYAADATKPLPVGTFNLQVVGAAGAGTTVDAYVSDDKSSWAVGAAWDPSIATDVATIGVPSVADHCIAVNAEPDHVSTEGSWFDNYYDVYDVPAGYQDTAGELRAYSPRGPRIDGVQKPDIIAPDNPWVAYVSSPGMTYTGPYGSFGVFGGTSGASPHVTGTAALLAEAGIKGDAARDAIRKGAITDSSMGTLPNGNYGSGRLSAAGAFGIAISSVIPTVTLVATVNGAPLVNGAANIGDSVTLTATPTGGNSYTVKWDDNYDGTWDVAYAPLAPRVVSGTAPGVVAYKAHVRADSGRVAEAVTYVTYGTAPVTPAAAPASSTSGGCACNTTRDKTSLGSLAGSLFLASIAAAAVRRRKRAKK